MSNVKNIAILVPCYNEAATIEKVVKDCRQYIPTATVYVYDNNSTDETKEIAQKAGAIVRRECKQGKGNVVRRMFADVDADIYVMIDGDATYDVSAIPQMIEKLCSENLDMVVGCRKETEQECYRSGHRWGNRLLTDIVSFFLGGKLKDMLSGLRVFSKRFVKTFPARSEGFEIETELTIYAISRKLPVAEVDTDYFSRPENSFSKLSTYKDGFRILKTIVWLIKYERPLLFFGLISLFLMIVALLLGIPVVTEYFKTGFVPRFPTAILASSIGVCSLISFLIGIVLDSVVALKKENSRICYLSYNGEGKNEL